ncbi:MAG: hypothetical protein OFPI_32760 [Osedax symbiont Rs2]|nr:MAG: hypothetical protein OFPI_32760 [Osedax symbiont Rs2]
MLQPNSMSLKAQLVGKYGNSKITLVFAYLSAYIELCS